MLMQLVCVDRRYQRMNCFNIRELQGILKRRFFSAEEASRAQGIIEACDEADELDD